MFSTDPGPPPPLALPKVDDPEARALIDAAIAAGKVTVCPGVGEGASIEHYDDRHDGLTGAERRAALNDDWQRKVSAALAPKRERDRQVVRDYRSGLSPARIMAKHGLKAVQSVRFIVKRDAPEIMRPRGRPTSKPRRPRVDKAERNKQIAEDYDAGMTPAQIAAKHGLSLSSAKRIVKTTAPEIVRHSRQRDSGKGGEAWKLRSEGMSWPAIAEALGYASAKGAAKEARKHAERHGQPWPPA